MNLEVTLTQLLVITMLYLIIQLNQCKPGRNISPIMFNYLIILLDEK